MNTLLLAVIRMAEGEASRYDEQVVETRLMKLERIKRVNDAVWKDFVEENFKVKK